MLNSSSTECLLVAPMGKKAKTRFVVSVDGQLRELISVREQRGGKYPTTIRINFRHGEFLRDGADRIPIANQYYSVHESPNSDGNLLHQTIELANGMAIDTPHFSLGIGQGRFALLMTSIPPDLRKERYSVKRRTAKDTLIEMGRFDPERGNIVWSLVISGTSVPLDLTSLGLNSSYADFSSFRVTVIWSFIGIRPTADGDRLHFLTGLPGVKGQSHGHPQLSVAAVDGADAAEVDSLVYASIAMFHSTALDKLPYTGPQRRLLESVTSPRSIPY